METSRTSTSSSHGRHAKPKTHGSHLAVKPKRNFTKYIPELGEWNFAAVALRFAVFATLSLLAYAVAHVFNTVCPPGSAGACARVPASSFGPFFEIAFLILSIIFVLISAICASEAIARMMGAVKAYSSIALLTIMLLLISAAVPQELMEKAVFRFFG